ncbi:hypothetical protein CYQ11_10845 [Streptomyces cinnamoneus]|nr:hypothetical protein CYQ11_10845 [Streptomyces cinnamoneus]
MFLLALVLGPVVCGAGSPVSAGASAARYTAATGDPVEQAAPRADDRGTGGSCHQQDLPLKGAEVAVAHAQADPLTAPGTPRAAPLRARARQVTPPRAPPLPVAGCAELLPVLRI